MNIVQEGFSVNLRILSILRLYSSDNAKSLKKIQTYFGYFFFAVLFPVLGLLCFLFEEQMDQTQTNFNVIVVAESLGFIPKLLPFVRSQSKLRKCINYFDTFCLPSSDEHLEIIKKCAKTCQRNSIWLLSVVTFCFWGVICRPIIMRDYMLPFYTWFPFNSFDTKTRFVYYALYIYQFMGGIYVAIAGTIVDPLIGGLIYHSANQLVVLQLNLQNLSKYDKKEFLKKKFSKGKSESEIVYEEIKECARHYEGILRFIQYFSECFSFAIFGQFASSTIVFCFSCLQLFMVNSLLNVNTFISVSIIIVVLGQIYFYCYFGTLLYEENCKLSNAIYSSNWYEFDIKSRKALLIMMKRSQRPTIITTGKLLDLSLDTFTAVLKRSYSLLAVLRNYQ